MRSVRSFKHDYPDNDASFIQGVLLCESKNNGRSHYFMHHWKWFIEPENVIIIARQLAWVGLELPDDHTVLVYTDTNDEVRLTETITWKELGQ